MSKQQQLIFNFVIFLLGVIFYFINILYYKDLSVTHYGWSLVHAVLYELIIFIPSILFVKKLYPFYLASGKKWIRFFYVLLTSVAIFLVSFYSLTFVISQLPAHLANTQNLLLSELNKNRIFTEIYPIQFLAQVAWIALSFLLVIPINQLIYSNSKYLENKKNFKALQLKLLQQRLTPHYLFNELNNIYALSALENPDFKKYICHFEKFFQLIKGGKQEAVVDITNELQLVKDYLDFQKIRLRDDVSIVLDFEAFPKRVRILSLSYFILIENAIKHCNYESGEIGHIFISYKYKNGRSIFFVKNSTLNHNNTSSGVGLRYLTERVSKFYQHNYQFSSEIKEGFYETTLIINHIN